MTHEGASARRAIAAAFHDSLGVGNHAGAAGLLSSDVIVHSPTPGMGKKLALHAANRCFVTTPAAPPRPDPCFSIVDGDIVATCYFMPQTRPDGSVEDLYWIDSLRIEDGSITEWWASINEAAPTQLTWTTPTHAPSNQPAKSSDRTMMKRLAVDFYREVFDSEDARAVARFVTEDYRQHAQRFAPGRSGLEDLVGRMFPLGPRPKPDPMTLEPVVLAAEGDIVVHGVRLAQTDPTAGGSTYPYIVFDAYRVRDGKLAEHWSGVNSAAPPIHDIPIGMSGGAG